ncbi:MAG: hypothetical protein MUP24_06830 [Gillisia sp.]|nr:hypothetical protein [Gillisia sp.]
MKNLFFAIALILSINISAQEGTEKTNIYVRVYDLQSKLISKGNMLSISGTSLQLKEKKIWQIEISANSIGLIKTRRSAWRNVIIGTIIGATAGAIIGEATTEPDPGPYLFYDSSGNDGAALGWFLGASTGAAIGGITTLFKKKSRIFIINGDELKWKEFKETITGLSNSN